MDLRRRIGGLLRACHPEPALAVTLVTTSFAVMAGIGTGVVWLLPAVLCGQLSVGWSNDVIDRHRDAAAGRRDKPIVSGDVPASVVAAGAVVALVLAVPLSFGIGWRAALVHIVGLAAATSYNLGVKATPFSPLPYAVAFGGLPAFVVLGLEGHPAPPLWLVAAGALVGIGAHFANVVPDVADDIRLGVVGLPHRFGARGAAVVAALLLVAASVVLALGPSSGPGIAGVAGMLSRRPGSRMPFRIAIAVALVDVALLLARGPVVLD